MADIEETKRCRRWEWEKSEECTSLNHTKQWIHILELIYNITEIKTWRVYSICIVWEPQIAILYSLKLKQQWTLFSTLVQTRSRERAKFSGEHGCAEQISQTNCPLNLVWGMDPSSGEHENPQQIWWKSSQWLLGYFENSASPNCLYDIQVTVLKDQYHH